ncbi:signal-regulatory protein gamma-like [Macrotis lagotis]|uniref:signal-regulatory protein gamma-like n=1 Tax=Macrotis lagotis TaxID=92651 RepID=UPI003D68F6C2
MFSLSFWASALLTLLNIKAWTDAQDVIIEQPSSTVTATIGGSAILPCRSKSSIPGSVKWFKGIGPNRQLIYSDIGLYPRVQKVNNTNEILDICITNITSQDEGTYYCVKFKKTSEEEFSSGRGTHLIIGQSQSQSQSSPDVLIAALVGSMSLIILILLVLCCYLKRQKGLRSCLSRPEASKKNQPLKEPRGNNEIVYADLQPIGEKHQSKSSAQVKDLHSEYATIHV